MRCLYQEALSLLWRSEDRALIHGVTAGHLLSWTPRHSKPHLLPQLCLQHPLHGLPHGGTFHCSQSSGSDLPVSTHLSGLWAGAD